MNHDSLDKYFSSQISSVPLSPHLNNSIQILLRQISSQSRRFFETLNLKVIKPDEQNKLKLEVYQETKPGLNELKGLEQVIECKYENIREMEKDIEEIRQKIEIIDEYEEYLEEYRKPGLLEKNESIEYFVKAKKQNLAYINSILNDKKKLYLDSGMIAAKIQIMYRDIERDEKLLGELNKIIESNLKKKMMRGKHFDLVSNRDELIDGGNNTIKETSEEYSKSDVSGSRSQTMLTSLFLNSESIGNQDISHISKTNLTIKIQEIKKSQILDIKKGHKASLNKKQRVKLPELSRTNQERLAIIEGRQRYGESYHNQITPTLGRVKRLEKDNKNYFSPVSRAPDHQQASYKSLSPRQGFNL